MHCDAPGVGIGSGGSVKRRFQLRGCLRVCRLCPDAAFQEAASPGAKLCAPLFPQFRVIADVLDVKRIEQEPSGFQFRVVARDAVSINDCLRRRSVRWCRLDGLHLQGSPLLRPRRRLAVLPFIRPQIQIVRGHDRYGTVPPILASAWSSITLLHTDVPERQRRCQGVAVSDMRLRFRNRLPNLTLDF